jgi:hypothetical protein
MDKPRDILRAAFLEVVDNQIRDGTPPATRQAFERLQREGHTATKAKEMIAALIAADAFEIIKHNRAYNEPRFVERLHRLPEMPWGDDDAALQNLPNHALK